MPFTWTGISSCGFVALLTRMFILASDHLQMAGTNGSIFAIGDCAASGYAPTAQVARQQGAYVARAFAQLAKKDQIESQLKALETSGDAEAKAESLKTQLGKIKLRPFHYSHQGSLAYVSSCPTVLPSGAYLDALS